MNLFWNSCRENLAHLGTQERQRDLQAGRFKNICKSLNLIDKVVIDYGCGGGLLGDYLLNNTGIKKYIGYDVSERSLSHSGTRLKKFSDKIELNLVKHHDIDFSLKFPDIIFCIACIIHFPSKEYLDRYLDRWNKSGAKTLILEIRNSEKTQFTVDPYSENIDSVIWACKTNKEYISDGLPGYTLIEDGVIGPTGCKILVYEKNNG